MAGWFDELAKLIDKKVKERDAVLKLATDAGKKKDTKKVAELGKKALELDKEVERLVAKIDAASKLDKQQTIDTLRSCGFG